MITSKMHNADIKEASRLQSSFRALWGRVLGAPHRFVLAIIFLLGFLLRAHCLDCHGLWFDEIQSVETAQRGISSIFTERFGYISNQTPWHYLLVWLTTQISDPVQTTALVRLPSLLAGALTPLVVYGLGRETLGRVPGLVAALICALSTPLVDYSQEARPYSLLVFLTASTLYCLLMAERTRNRAWWLLFVASAIMNLLNSIIAITLVMPALAPCFLWVLLSLWSRRREQGGGKQLTYALLSMLTVGCATALMLQALGEVSGVFPSLSGLTVDYVVNMVITVLSSVTSFVAVGQAQAFISALFLALALAGFYMGWRAGGQVRRGTGFFALILIISMFEVTLIAATRILFQRYYLFIIPFLYLLISNALVSIALLAHRLTPTGVASARRVKPAIVGALVTLALSPFAFDIIYYNTEIGHEKLSYRPDYRGVADYLDRYAQHDDTVVFVDDSLHGVITTNFYWRGTPPVTTYDARDPLLYAHEARGNIYWVIRSWAFDRAALQKLAASSRANSEASYFELVLVLRERESDTDTSTSTVDMASRVEALAERIGTLDPNGSLVASLVGSIKQARGDVAGAIARYRTIPDPNPLWEESLEMAEGLYNLGKARNAWLYALVALYDSPANPQIHVWMAERLAADGHETASRIAREIAEGLSAPISTSDSR